MSDLSQKLVMDSVGNGHFAEKLNENLKLVHLRKRDKRAGIYNYYHNRDFAAAERSDCNSLMRELVDVSYIDTP